MNLVLLEPHEIDASGDATLSDARAAHLLDVLSAAPGRSIRIGLVDGPCGTGTVTATSRRAVTIRCVFEQDRPPRPPVDLLLALPRPKVMRRLWPQLAAIGVGRVLLTNADRVERNYFDTHILNVDEYRPLLIEGLQQARDTRVPVVSIHRQLKILVEDHLDALCPDGTRLLADPSGSTPLDSAVREGAATRVLVAIGPEGGWNDFERALFGAHGFRSVGMGPRTLRSDTACIALLTLAHHAIAGHAPS